MSSSIVIASRSFQAGQIDTPGEEGLEFPALVAVENLDVSTGKARRRKGHYVIGRPTINVHDGFEFTGGHIIFDTTDANMFDLDRYWTADVFFFLGATSGTQGIWTWNHATDWPFEWTVVGTTLTVKCKPQSGSTITLTHTVAATTHYACRLVRNDLTLELWVNGTIVDTDTIADSDSETTSGLNSMYLGRDQGGSNVLSNASQIHYARVFSKAYGDHALAYRHHPWPRAKHVLFCVDGDVVTLPSAGTGVLDKSRHQLHGQFSGSVASGSSACVASTPVRMLRHLRDGAGKRYLFLGANGEFARREIV